MKKYGLYALVLLCGIIFGWLLFGHSATHKTTSKEGKSEQPQLWTCSMHPQIIKSEPGKCPICGMDLIPLKQNEDLLPANQIRMTEEAMALANVATSIVGYSDSANNSETISGTLAENERTSSVQTAYFGGRIETLNISVEGDHVVQGQKLATFYSPELYQAQQELLTSYASRQSQPALYQSVVQKFRLWKFSDKQIQAIIDRDKPLAYVPVDANMTGTVTQMLVKEGENVSPGQPLMKIADLQTLWANFDVYENQIANFKVGQILQIRVRAFPGKNIKAKIVFIDPEVNPQTRTITVRALLDNRSGNLKPGMFIQADVTVGNPDKRSITVPASAVLWTGKRSVIYVKPMHDMPVFELREITLGQRLGDSYEVIDGLKSGEEVVTQGVFTVDAAAQLQGKTSMMNPSNQSK